MASAQDALDWMRARLGTGEDPPGSNCNEISQQFYKAAGKPDALAPGCYSWCAASVSLALNSAWGDENRWQVPGVVPTYPNGIAWVPGLRMAFRNASKYGATPVIGAVNIYAWAPGEPIGDHTGLTEAWVDWTGQARTDEFVAEEWDSTVIALEGNHNNELVRIRRSMAVIDGFAYPDYDSPPPIPSPQSPQEDNMAAYTVTIPPGEERFVPTTPNEGSGGLPWGKVFVSLSATMDTPAQAVRIHGDPPEETVLGDDEGGKVLVTRGRNSPAAWEMHAGDDGVIVRNFGTDLKRQHITALVEVGPSA